MTIAIETRLHRARSSRLSGRVPVACPCPLPTEREQRKLRPPFMVPAKGETLKRDLPCGARDLDSASVEP